MSNQLNPRVRPGIDTGLKSNPTVLTSARSGSRTSLPPQVSRSVLSSGSPAYNSPACWYSLPACSCCIHVGALTLSPHDAFIAHPDACTLLIPFLGRVGSPTVL